MNTSRWSIIAALLAAVAAALAPPEPTGSPVVDAVLLAAGTAVVVLVGARAPWWITAVCAGVALAVAADPVLMALAALAVGAALWVGFTRRERPDVLAVSVGLLVNVLARAELDADFGTTAVISGAVVLVLLVAGVVRQPKRARRVTLIGAGALVVLGAAATIGFGVAAAKSRDDLSDGLHTAEEAVVMLEHGQYEEAAATFRTASDLLDRANQRMTEPWTVPAAAVPVVAQHRDAVLDMSDAGSAGADTVADALDAIDLDALRAVGGHFELDALAALEAPLTEVRGALMDLQDATKDARSPWLVDRADVELDDFEGSLDAHLPPLERSLRAIRLAPGMLGADAPRTYLVLFTTPSEARGLGGFAGSYAELTADDGQLTLSNFGRTQELDAAAQAAGARVIGHPDFLRQYGTFGFDTDDEGAVGSAAFRNLTMTPDFPTVGDIAADLYAQTTGRDVDGVIVMDPFVVAAFLGYTGPIELSDLEQPLTVDNAVPYLLLDQYVVGEDVATRTDALAEASQLTFDTLFAGALPDPITLARDLAPLTEERRLVVWSADEEEQALLEEVNVAGPIPDLEGSDGWSVTLTNAGGNKIDSFLLRRASYDATTDPSSGETAASLRLELTNTAPADGYPDYVIGNFVELPRGSSRLYVSFYSPLGLSDATLDGEPTELSTGWEEGWNVYSQFVDIPPGGTVTFDVELAGTVAEPDDVVTWVQPMASPLEALG